jgi:uncharacterized protein
LIEDTLTEIRSVAKSVGRSIAKTHLRETENLWVKTTTDARQVVRRTIDHLRQNVTVRQAILFGSHAQGRANEWSDVDLAVISPDFVGMSHRRLIDLLVETALAVDSSVEIHAFTPRDLKEARPTNFLGHILAEGKVVFKNGRFLL